MSIKRLVSLLLVLVICSMSLVSFAQGKEQSQLDVYHINSEESKMDFYLNRRNLKQFIEYAGSDIYSIVNGNTFMQFRNLGDALNITLYWNQNTREVSLDSNGKSIVLKIGSKVAHIDNEEVELNVAPFIKNGRTFIPLRFVSEALGINVNYVDVRPEGEFAKKAILEHYPSIKRMIDLGTVKQEGVYIVPRLRVNAYNPETRIMEVTFEEFDKKRNWIHKSDIINRFNTNIEERTIHDFNLNKITVDWYEKEIEENN